MLTFTVQGSVRAQQITRTQRESKSRRAPADGEPPDDPPAAGWGVFGEPPDAPPADPPAAGWGVLGDPPCLCPWPEPPVGGVDSAHAHLAISTSIHSYR